MTINDIARAVGVSTATVSRVMNGGPVSAATRSRVEAAIATLDYTPNALARGLMLKSSRAIGVLTTSMSNQYYTQITETVERTFREWGFMQFLGCTEGDESEERRYLTDLVSRRVDGVLVLDPANANVDSGFLTQLARRIPLVLVHSLPCLEVLDAVRIDQGVGMTLVMEHLLGLGHRDIAFLRGRYGHSYDVKERAWREGRERAGLTGPGSLWVVEDGNTEAAVELARGLALRLLASRPRPTAVFACNDLMALGTLQAARQLGLRVPHDLSLVGHDNTLLSAHSSLASVDLQMRSVALAAAELLHEAMERRSTPRREVLITPRLVLRESTSRPDGVTMQGEEIAP